MINVERNSGKKWQKWLVFATLFPQKLINIYKYFIKQYNAEMLYMETIQFENMQFVNLTEFHLSNLALVGKYFASKTYCLSDAYAGGGSIAKRNAEKDAINRMEEQCGWSYKIIDYNMNGFSSGYLLQLQQYTALVIDTQQWRRVVDIRTGRCLNGHYEIYCQQLEKQKKLLKRNCCEWDLMSL